MLRTASMSPTKDGGYLLATYPGCTTLHQGQYEGTSIYVVGRNTEFERLYAFSQLAEATTWAVETFQQIENIPTSGMCDQAVRDVYEGRLTYV
jgi:hypothetical protein